MPDRKNREFEKNKHDQRDMLSSCITAICESYLSDYHRLPTQEEISRKLRMLLKSNLSVNRDTRQIFERTLDRCRNYRKRFERRLYDKWRKPIDNLEILVNISIESGSRKNKRIANLSSDNNFKAFALVRIHARALHVANEILTLLKSRYADGAFARWRTLYELSVIAFVLNTNNNEISRRFLEHDIVKRKQELEDYDKYHRELGYSKITSKQYHTIQKRFENLFNNYQVQFGSLLNKSKKRFKSDYGWIPPNILSDPNLRKLSEHIKLDKLYLYYSTAGDAVHGGPRGFYRMSLMRDTQDELLLVGPSNYGLADPIQLTAISVHQISSILLAFEADFDSLINMKLIENLVNEIKFQSVEVQTWIEKEGKCI